MVIWVKLFAGRVEGCDVVFGEGLQKHSVGHLDTGVEVFEVGGMRLVKALAGGS